MTLHYATSLGRRSLGVGDHSFWGKGEVGRNGKEFGQTKKNLAIRIKKQSDCWIQEEEEEK